MRHVVFLPPVVTCFSAQTHRHRHLRRCSIVPLAETKNTSQSARNESGLIETEKNPAKQCVCVSTRHSTHCSEGVCMCLSKLSTATGTQQNCARDLLGNARATFRSTRSSAFCGQVFDRIDAQAETWRDAWWCHSLDVVLEAEHRGGCIMSSWWCFFFSVQRNSACDLSNQRVAVLTLKS